MLCSMSFHLNTLSNEARYTGELLPQKAVNLWPLRLQVWNYPRPREKGHTPPSPRQEQSPQVIFTFYFRAIYQNWRTTTFCSILKSRDAQWMQPTPLVVIGKIIVWALVSSASVVVIAEGDPKEVISLHLAKIFKLRHLPWALICWSAHHALT